MRRGACASSHNHDTWIFVAVGAVSEVPTLNCELVTGCCMAPCQVDIEWMLLDVISSHDDHDNDEDIMFWMQSGYLIIYR